MKPITKISILSLLTFCCINVMAGGSGKSINSVAKVPLFVNENSFIADPATGEDSAADKMDNKYKAAISRLKQQGQAIASYAKANNYNTEIVFLMDMTLPSGKNRFFVYNIAKDEVVTSSLVTHGFGSNKYENDDPLQFSNIADSKMTSLGKYKIGKSYFGQFGLAYKLYGLDSTNDRAFERDIVLHSHKRVPEKETYPGYIIVSSGCPTVSPAFLTKLDGYIKTSKKPILLWIYN